MPQLAYSLSRSFILILGISLALGGPISYLINNAWLESFPNRVTFGWETVLLAVILMTALAAITTLSQVFKVARTNPIVSLRDE